MSYFVDMIFKTYSEKILIFHLTPIAQFVSSAFLLKFLNYQLSIIIIIVMIDVA